MVLVQCVLFVSCYQTVENVCVFGCGPFMTVILFVLFMLKFNRGRDLMNEFLFCKVSTLETAKPHMYITKSGICTDH